MSNIDTKAPTKPKSTTKRGATKATPAKNSAGKFVEESLATAERKYVRCEELAFTELNARITPRSPEDIEAMATSIEGTGLLQNLVVHVMDDGRYGVAAGETRRLALELLKEQNRAAAGERVTTDFMVAVLVVDTKDAYAISVAENVRRTNLQPADQLETFRRLAENGTPAERIGAILGYSTMHVKKCLKLTTIAPQLLELLKTNEISIDQLSALGATDDHKRQIQAWENGKYASYMRSPVNLRKSVLDDAISAESSDMVDFVGVDAYVAAGGETREDLFAESLILTNPLQLQTMAIEKLQQAADEVVKAEGWKWGEGRINAVKTWGDDEKSYNVLVVCDRMTDEQRDEIHSLSEEEDLLQEEIDNDPAKEAQNLPRIAQIDERIDEIKEAFERSKWSSEMRAEAGIIAYLEDGKIRIQRGVKRMEDVRQENKAEREKIKEKTPPSERGLTQALVTSLSAERTLAVSAALAQNSHVAIALHTFNLVNRVFDGGYSYVLDTSLTSHRGGCLSESEAAGSEKGTANMTLNELHESLLNRFPEDWKDGFEWLLEWPQADVLSLMTYCISQALNGREAHMYDNRVGSRLSSIENALNFDIAQWWQPTADNYFARISKDQLIDALDSAGQSGNARDAEKMKRKEAAEFAESVLTGTGWLPTCMAPEKLDDADSADAEEPTNNDSAAA